MTPSANQRISILHLVSGLFYGGGQRVVLDLRTGLPQVGCRDVRVCVMGEGDGKTRISHDGLGVPYCGRYNRLGVVVRTARRVRAMVRAEGVAILHTHGLDADLIGAVALRGTRARQVCHLHISPPVGRRESWRARLRKSMFGYLTRRATFIAVSEAVREQMAAYYRLPLERIITVRNGVDLGSYSQDEPVAKAGPRSTLTMGTAARLAPMKGLEHMIHALRLLLDRGVNIEWRVAGSGSEQPRLEAMARELGVAERVHFLGQVSDMQAFYKSIDVFVLPSVSTEGLPLVVLEAMAMRRAVVATTVGGTPEVIRDGEHGLLVSPGDSAALANAIERLARDPALRRRLADAGRRRVEAEFTLEHTARGVAAVYERVIAEAKAGR